MNPLYCGSMPERVTVFGRSVAVGWSHTEVLRLFSMAGDPEIPSSIKGSLAARMFFREDVFRLAAETGAEDPGKEIADAMVSFLSGGGNGSSAPPHGAPVFDFDYDAELIYGAFFETYGIDLSARKLHWWKFRALFRSLSAETEFMRVLSIRSSDLSSIPEGEERARLRRLRARFALPVRGTADERARMFGSSVKF